MKNDSNGGVIVVGGKRFVSQSKWAQAKNISPRTAARYRGDGLESIEWGGVVYIGEEDGDRYFLSRVRRRNPPRAAREHSRASR